MALNKKVVNHSTTNNKVATNKTSTPSKTTFTALPTRQTKTQILQAIAAQTGLTRQQLAALFGAMDGLITRHRAKRGSGEFTIPDIGLNLRKVIKARMGRNPATGESIRIPAKPQRTVI